MSTNKPVNDIIRIAERDANLPSTGKANKQIPKFGLRDLGYDDGEFLSSEELNYTFDNMGQWLAYFDNRVDELQKQAEDDKAELLDEAARLKAQIEKERVSVGEIIEITGDPTNPSVLKGYGTWQSFGEGQVTVGVGSHTDVNGDTSTWTDAQSSGEYRHTQTLEELATHSHGTTVSNDTHTHDVTTNSDSNTTGGYITASRGTSVVQTASGKLSDYTHKHVVTISSAGGSSPMNNIQPSLAVYRWKRIS